MGVFFGPVRKKRGAPTIVVRFIEGGGGGKGATSDWASVTGLLTSFAFPLPPNLPSFRAFSDHLSPFPPSSGFHFPSPFWPFSSSSSSSFSSSSYQLFNLSQNSSSMSKWIFVCLFPIPLTFVSGFSIFRFHAKFSFFPPPLCKNKRAEF